MSQDYTKIDEPYNSFLERQTTEFGIAAMLEEGNGAIDTGSTTAGGNTTDAGGPAIADSFDLGPNSVTPTKISANQLSAIAADLGAITAGTITLNTSGHIKSGQTAFNTGSGFWLGFDAGTSKFSIGDPTGEYMYWDGSDLVLNGYNLTTIVEGATADINFGLFRGSYNDGLTETVSNATITRKILTTSVEFSTGSTGWSLQSGTFGQITASSEFSFQRDYEFFVRLKSDTGTSHTTSLEGRSYFWGLMESAGSLPTFTDAPLLRGKVIDDAHFGFIVDFDNKLFATSGSGSVTTGTKALASQDITDLSASVTHTNENNYRIVTHYAAQSSVTDTGFIRPTSHTDVGVGWSNESNAYDGSTSTYTNSSVDTNVINYCTLSWDGGTSWTQAVLTGVDGTKTTHTIGGATDTWGRKWSVSELSNANFKVRFFTGSSYVDVITANAIDFTSFGFSTASMVDITGIAVELTAEREDPGGGTEGYIYDIRVKIYYTTAASAGYIKFYVNDVLVATHTASIPRGTELPTILFAAKQGLNVASGKHIFFNNYKVKAIT